MAHRRRARSGRGFRPFAPVKSRLKSSPLSPKHVEGWRLAPAHCPKTQRRDRLPVPPWPRRRWPALSCLPGPTPVHNARRAAAPQCRLARPISASISRGGLSWPPGILPSGSRGGALGRPSRATKARAPGLSRAWCAVNCPWRASARWASCRRRVPPARADRVAGARAPATGASTRRRPLVPNPAATPGASWQGVAARIVSPRCVAGVRLCPSATRVRGRARQARICGGGTPRGGITPGASRAASQAAARWAVVLPGRCRIARLLATRPSTPALRPWRPAASPPRGAPAPPPDPGVRAARDDMPPAQRRWSQSRPARWWRWPASLPPAQTGRPRGRLDVAATPHRRDDLPDASRLPSGGPAGGTAGLPAPEALCPRGLGRVDLGGPARGTARVLAGGSARRITCHLMCNFIVAVIR